jgi:hypothetical protein
LDTFVAGTIKWFLILFGLATCATLPFAIDIKFLTPMLGGLVDYTPSSVPALRHWGAMVCGIGVLMVVAAVRPWLRFETMVFSTIEKSFMVYLFSAMSAVPGGWATCLLSWSIQQSSRTASCTSSGQGRPGRWIQAWTNEPRSRTATSE